VLAVTLGGVRFGHAQTTITPGETAIVMPFENQSGAPGIEWIGESFPAVLGQRLGSPTLYVLTREDRLRAYDRAGIPAELHPSRATVYRIAEDMDVDFVVLGHYSFDGRVFTAAAQVLDMRNVRLLPEVTESGPLVDLIHVQTALGWDLLHSLRASISMTKEAFVNGAPPIRLDAFENYIRGILATSTDEKVRRLREAVRLNPAYGDAWLQLGKTYYSEQQYAQAVSALAQVPTTDGVAREANFYLGLSAYYQADFAKAEAAFNFVAARLPLTEVYNNLGVVSSRRGKKIATDYFQKAVQQDPNDADYHFNLAVALYRSGDIAGATRELKQCLALRPNDAEARSLSDSVAGSAKLASGVASAAPARVPLERIKRNYDESSFRQLFVEVQAAAEQRLAKADSATRTNFYVGRGQELLAQGFVAEAEKEFRTALTLTPENAQAHSGLASVLEAQNDFAGARSEAEAALQLKPMAEPLLVLARLDLRDNKAEAAAQNVDRALQLEPNNASALALKRAVAAKLAEKAQPLPN
jgi:tetratricopeptide (TPR) repeat protein/TolB-like protein